MSTIKVLLGAVAALLVVAVIGLIFLLREVTTLTETPASTMTMTEEAASGNATQPASGAAPNESVTIDRSQLSEGQQRMLSSLGIDTESFTINPEMMACAEAEVGTERIAAFEAGETPTVAEGAALLGCLRTE